MLKFAAIVLLGLYTSAYANQTVEKIPGCYIVSFKSNDKGKLSSPNAQAQSNLFKAQVKSFGKITAEYSRALNGFTVCGVKFKSQLNSIRNHPLVNSIEQDQVVQANALRTISAATWGLDRIDQRSLPLDGNYTYNDTSAPVNVYVFDTGILTSHEQFQGRAFAGYNFVDSNSDSNDCHGHGTHCAGTIGGKDYGVCKHCRLIAVKVLGCSGSGSVTGIISGINWVISHAQSTGIPSVMSMSLGGANSFILNDAVNNAVNAGIVAVVSAGNSNADACNQSPASTPSAITVGAISQSGAKSSYSNFGSCVDIFAPGDSITSASIGANNSVRIRSGTSMAAPHVAGVAAIYRSYNPSKNATEVRNFIVDHISTLNAIRNLDPLSPNRLLYSKIDNLNQGDRTLPPTVAPTLSPTLASLPTLAPTATPLLFERNLTLSESSLNYYGSEFNSSVSQYLLAEMFSISADVVDLDLYLEVKNDAGNWGPIHNSMNSGSSSERIAEKIIAARTCRWRIVVSKGSSPMSITFRSNIPDSINFVSFTSLSWTANITIIGTNRNYFGREFSASLFQPIDGRMLPLSDDDMDLDLHLEIKKGASWTLVRSTGSGGSSELISHIAAEAGIYRWRINVFSGNSRMLIAFSSNIAESIEFAPPTRSPTRSPTSSPTPTKPHTPVLSSLSSVNLTIIGANRNYFGREFNASLSEFLFGRMLALSAENVLLELLLEIKSGDLWTVVRSSQTLIGRSDSISHVTTSAGIYRWRISISQRTSEMNITFFSNVAKSIVFVADTPVTLFPTSLTVFSEKKNYFGTPFTAEASQFLTANFFPVSRLRMNLDLYLERNEMNWTVVSSSTGLNSNESIAFTTLLSGTYRWRIFIFGNTIPGLRMNLTFGSNIPILFN